MEPGPMTGERDNVQSSTRPEAPRAPGGRTAVHQRPGDAGRPAVEVVDGPVADRPGERAEGVNAPATTWQLRRRPIIASLAICAITGVALSLPASRQGGGSSIGLGATLGTGSRLGGSQMGLITAVTLVVLAAGGLCAVLMSLVSPHLGLRFAVLFASIVFIGALAGIAALRTAAGPALLVLAVGCGGLLASISLLSHHDRRAP